MQLQYVSQSKKIIKTDNTTFVTYPNFSIDKLLSDNNYIDFALAFHKEFNTFVINLNESIQKHKMLEYILKNMTQTFLPNETRKQIVFTSSTEIDKNIIDRLNIIIHSRVVAILPSNIATPQYMASAALAFAKKNKHVKVTVLNEKQLKKEGLNLILSVGSSSVNKPRLAILEYKSSKSNAKTVCIIGKGITYDSGGLSLKPIKYQLNMKCDKIGAVYGFGAFQYIISHNPDVNIIGLFPYADNVVSGSSVRSGDVIKSYSGKTVEIVDPDAEGRLILADTISYAIAKYKPETIIELSTLTGNAEIVNCFSTAYVFASNPIVEKMINRASDRSYENLLIMPRWLQYTDKLESAVADIKQINISLPCDAFMAALFLNSFATVKNFVHFDLRMELKNDIPTGAGILSVIYLLQQLIEKMN